MPLVSTSHMEVVTHSVLVSYRSEQTNYPTQQQPGVDVVTHLTFSVLEKNGNLVKSASYRSCQLLVQKLNYNQTVVILCQVEYMTIVVFILTNNYMYVSAHKQSNENATYVLNCQFFEITRLLLRLKTVLKKTTCPLEFGSSVKMKRACNRSSVILPVNSRVEQASGAARQRNSTKCFDDILRIIL